MAREGELAEFWTDQIFVIGKGWVGLDGALEIVREPRFEELETMPRMQRHGDWRWHVPVTLAEHWGELCLEARLAILAIAQIEADDQSRG